MFLYVLKVENYALCTIRLQNKQKKMKQANFLSKNASKSLQVRLCKHMRHLFPDVVSYNRFVELERGVAIPLIIFIKKVLLGKCTGISFVDSTPLKVCRNQRILMHKTFKGIAQRGKCSMG